MKIEVEVEEIITLNSRQDWIKKCPYHLPDKIHERDEFIFIDKFGRFLHKGLDFIVAEKQGFYPVKVYRKCYTRNYVNIPLND
jgi:hypothetical protein